MRKTVLFGFAAACLCACQSMLPEKVDIVSVGIVPDDIEVAASAGEDGVRVIADRDYSVEVVSGADWLSSGLAGSDTLSFSFSANEGFRRSGRIRISACGRADELLVRQQGPFREKLSLSEHDVAAPVPGCSVSIRVLSNIPSDYFTATSSNDAAIDRLMLVSNVLSFDVLPTTNRDKRSYTVKVAYTDGWGEEISDSVTVIQDAYE